jgi:hypothetical protein
MHGLDLTKGSGAIAGGGNSGKYGKLFHEIKCAYHNGRRFAAALGQAFHVDLRKRLIAAATNPKSNKLEEMMLAIKFL